MYFYNRTFGCSNKTCTNTTTTGRPDIVIINAYKIVTITGRPYMACFQKVRK